MPSQQAKQLHGGSSAGEGGSDTEERTTILKKRGKRCFSKLWVTGSYKQGGSCRLLKRGRGNRLSAQSPPQRRGGVSKKAFLKYLSCLPPPCHTSHLLLRLSQWNFCEVQKIPSVHAESKRNEGGAGKERKKEGDTFSLPPFLTPPRPPLFCSSQNKQSSLD